MIVISKSIETEVVGSHKIGWHVNLQLQMKKRVGSLGKRILSFAVKLQMLVDASRLLEIGSRPIKVRTEAKRQPRSRQPEYTTKKL